MTKSKSSLGNESLLAELEETAGKAGVRLRYEKLAQGPVRAMHGSCRMRGEDVIIIDSRMKSSERVDALAQELARFNLDTVYVPPAVRGLLDRRRGRLGGTA